MSISIDVIQICTSDQKLSYKVLSGSLADLYVLLWSTYIILQDKYKRALADGENLRSRLTKQIAEAKVFGIQSFCKDLLDVADVLNKATETVPKEEINDKNPHLKSLYEGLLMTEAQLKAVFKRHGLDTVNPLNEKFNPNFHEALFQQVLLYSYN